MKKTISLILSVILILTALGCDAFAFGSVNQDQKTDVDYLFLSDLGLLTEEFEEAYTPDAKITRGEFVAMAVRLVNADNLTADIKFEDAAPGDKYYQALKSAVACGLITGDSGGCFNAEANISLCDAYVIVLRALGYDLAAQYAGGYPAGYLKKANELGLHKNLSSADGHISRKDTLKLFSNAVNCPVYEIIGVKDDMLYYSSQAENTILSVYYGIERFDGEIRALSTFYLENITLADDEVLIDDNIFKYNNHISTDLVGARVHYYVRRADNSVVTCVRIGNEGNIINIEADDISEYTGDSYVYYDGTKDRVARFDKSYEVVYNSRPAPALLSDEYIPSIGSVYLYDHDENGKYDIVRIENYETVVVDSVNARKETVTDKYTGKKYDLSLYDSYIITDGFGNNLTMESLREYDVISMSIPKDYSTVQIFYSNSEVYGTIEGRTDLGNVTKLVMFGEEKNLAPGVLTVIDEFQVGTSVAVSYDFMGNIACLRHESDVYRVGYLIGVAKGSGLDASVSFKIFSENGEMEILGTGKKVVVDGDAVDAVDLYEHFNDEYGNFNAQIIRYTQKDGSLFEIDTVDDAENGELQSVYKCYNNGVAEKTLWYSVYSKTFGGKVVPSAGAVYFSIPLNPVNDDEYIMFDSSKFDDRNSYSVDAYTTDAESLTADIFVMYRSDGGISDIPVNARGMLVESVTDIKDENGEYTKKITGMHLGKYTSYIVKDETVLGKIYDLADSSVVHTLGYGDVIRFSTDHIGRISEIQLLYQYDTGNVFEPTALGAMTTYRKKLVKAYKKSGGILQVTYESLDGEGINLDLSLVESVPADLYSIYLCRTERGKKVVQQGSMSDIVDYCSDSKNYSEIFMYDVNSDPNRGMIVVYE